MRVAKQRVAERTVGFTESVIREMTRLSAIHGGINLAQGFPNFPAPAQVKEAAKRAIWDRTDRLIEQATGNQS